MKAAHFKSWAWSQQQASRKLACLGYIPQHSYCSINMLGGKKLLKVVVDINDPSNILQSSSSESYIPILQVQFS